MKALRDWFWNRPLFHRLRPRIMTMILALVLPLSLICLVLSVVSVFQSAETSYVMSRNGFNFYIDQIALRQELGDIDILQGFPNDLAQGLKILYWNAGGRDPGLYNGGSVYVSRNSHEAFCVNPDGTWEAAEQSFEELKQAKYLFLWEKPDQPFQVLVTFPYDFAMRNIPVWFWFAILISLGTLVFCPLLYTRLRHDILSPMQTMAEAMDAFRENRAFRIPPQRKDVSDDFLRLFSEFNQMANEVQSSHEKDVKLLETEMDNLRLQVNPHMLLNSYNMIYALAESKNYPVIQEYTLCLVDYFRYVLRKGQQLVPLKQELDFVENYIHIQHIRFPNRFSYIYQAPNDCLNALIPPLLIENFVENAIKYALKPKEAIEIVVSVHAETSAEGEKKLHIAVIDTGGGIRPEVLERLKAHEPYIDEAGHKHIGIYNCVRRIELFYGEKGDIHFTSQEGQGTQAYMIIPCVYEEKAGKEAET